MARRFLAKEYERLKIERSLPPVKPYVYSARYQPKLFGEAYGHYRMLGISENLIKETQSVQDIDFLATLVHELSHACSKIVLRIPKSKNLKSLQFSNSRIAPLSCGWGLCVRDKLGNTRVCFEAFEEVAASLFDLAFYRSQGCKETYEKSRVTFYLSDYMHEKLQINNLIERLYAPAKHRLAGSNGLARHSRNAIECQQGIIHSIDQHGITISEPANCSLGGQYYSFVAAFDLLAPEIYSGIGSRAAKNLFRNELQRVQAEGGHSRIWTRLRETFGATGAKFLARLSTDQNSALLLNMFVDAKKLEPKDCAEVRQRIIDLSLSLLN